MHYHRLVLIIVIFNLDIIILLWEHMDPVPATELLWAHQDLILYLHAFFTVLEGNLSNLKWN